MLTGTLNPENILHLEYPKRARLTPVDIRTDGLYHARVIWNIRARKYIFETLTRWCKSRVFALRYMEMLTVKEEYAADRVMLAVDMNYERELKVLCLRVWQHRRDIALLAPGERSRYFLYYNEVIVPLVEWCNEVAGKWFPEIVGK